MIGKNFIEYADRSMTLGVLIIVAAVASLSRFPAFTVQDRRLMLKGAAWLVCGFALTLWLPVRSSLYVVFPSVGFAIVTATMVSAIAARATPARALRIAAAGLLLPFLLLPIYWSRNIRWSELRVLSNETFRAIGEQSLASRTLVVLEDDLTTRTNFRNAFGTLFPEAAALYFGEHLQLWIDPPSLEVLGAEMQRPGAERVVTFRLIDGRIERDTTVAALPGR